MGQVARCAGCPFKTKCIGTRGPVDSPFVIVGESPGTRELVMEKPFVGPSGQMLMETLNAAGFGGLGIEPYFINALSCYPAAKDIPKMKAATTACRNRVVQQISAHPRKVILSLGASAGWSTTGDFSLKITQDRGRIIPSPLAEKGIVLAVHPAYLMRPMGQAGYPMWKSDLKQAVDLLKDRKLEGWSPPSWSVIERPSQLIGLTKELHAAPLITADVETERLHWWGKRGLLCLGVTSGDGSHVTIIPEHIIYGAWPLMRRLLEGGRWNWHNGQFDVKWFRKERFSELGNIQANVHEDTMLMSYTMNENKGFHDLDQVAFHWIKAPKHKEAMSKYYKMAPHYSLRGAPLEELYHYNAQDLSKGHCVHGPIMEAMRSDPVIIDNQPAAIKQYYGTLIPAVPFIVEMQLYGVQVDQEKLDENEVAHELELKAIDAEIQVYAQKHIGANINPASPLQMKQLLYAKMGLGNMSMSTDESALIEIQRKYNHPIADLVLKRREVAKRKSTYVTSLRDHYKVVQGRKAKKLCPGHIKSDGRVHGDFRLHGTQTGRLAGSDPNLLNIPRGPLIRQQFRAAPGKIFVEVDLNQAELRSLALMSGDPLLCEIYTKNEVSIHDITTQAFYGLKSEIMRGEGPTYERAARQLQKTLGIPGDELWKEAKIRGKAVNFGIVFGREAFSLGKEYNIPQSEAQRWIDTWFDTYRGAADFIEWCRRAPHDNRTLITSFGYKKRPGVAHNATIGPMMNEFANFPHQSTAATIMLNVASEVYLPLRERYQAWIWLELYDAIYYEMPISDPLIKSSIEYVQQVVTRIPREHGLTRIPFLGDAKVGFDWGHLKDWQGSLIDTLGADALAQRMVT